jgi:tetratricopeptide (TPR) repeat protein
MKALKSKTFLGAITISALLLQSQPAWTKTGTEWMDVAQQAEKDHNSKKAIRAYKWASRSVDTHDDAIVALGKYVLTLGDAKTSRRVLEVFLRMDNPFPLEGHVIYADALWQDGDLIGATRELDIANALRPGYLPASELRGAIFYQAKKYDDAVANVTAYLKVHPESYRARMTRANSMFALGKVEFAIADFRILAEQNPEDVKVQTLLGDSFFVAEHLEDASRTFSVALGLAPQSAELYDKLAAVYDKQGKSIEAIALYVKAVELDSKNLELGQRLGKLQLRMKLTKDAEAEFKREYGIDAGFDPAVQELTAIWAAWGRFDQMGGILKKYTAVHPEQTWAVIRYTKLLTTIGQFSQASDIIKQNRKAVGETAENAVMEAMNKKAQGKKADALAILYEADAKFPGKPFVKFNIAVVEEDLGNFEKAVLSYREVAGDASLVYKSRINMAFALEKMGNVTESVQVLKAVTPTSDQKPMVSSKIADLERALNARDAGHFQSRLPASESFELKEGN